MVRLGSNLPFQLTRLVSPLSLSICFCLYLRLCLPLSIVHAVFCVVSIAILRWGVAAVGGIFYVAISRGLRLFFALLCAVLSVGSVFSIPILGRRVAAVVGVLAIAVGVGFWLSLSLLGAIFAVIGIQHVRNPVT